MEPADADAYFGKVLRHSPSGTRLGRSQALSTYFMFLELRHKVEIHRMTGRVVECPIDEMNRPRGAKDAQLRIPPSEPEVGALFTGWGGEPATCGKFAPTARNYTALWCGQPVSLTLDDLDVICVVLGCEIGDLLIPEPQKVTRPGEENISRTAVGAAAPVPAVVPKRRDGRSLPPA
ncbi:helix-turn-helix transcriptional regulator [Streptomyces hebeiensis]